MVEWLDEQACPDPAGSSATSDSRAAEMNSQWLLISSFCCDEMVRHLQPPRLRSSSPLSLQRCPFFLCLRLRKRCDASTWASKPNTFKIGRKFSTYFVPLVTPKEEPGLNLLETASAGETEARSKYTRPSSSRACLREEKIRRVESVPPAPTPKAQSASEWQVNDAATGRGEMLHRASSRVDHFLATMTTPATNERDGARDETASSEMGRRPHNHVSQVKASKFIHRTRHIAGASCHRQQPPSPSAEVTAKLVGPPPCMDGAIVASNIAATTAERRPESSEQKNCKALVAQREELSALPHVDCQDMRQEETKTESNAANNYQFEFAPSRIPRRPVVLTCFDQSVDLSDDDTSDCRSCFSDESPTSVSVDISNHAAAKKKRQTPKRYTFIRVEHNLQNVKGIIQQPERMKRKKKLSWHDDAENRDKPFILKSDVSFDDSTRYRWTCPPTCGRCTANEQPRRIWNSSLDSFDTLSVDSDWDAVLAQLVYRKNKYQETFQGYVSRARENIGRSISTAAGMQRGEASESEHEFSYLSFSDVTDATPSSTGDGNKGYPQPQSEEEKMSSLLDFSVRDLLAPFQ
ncbi:hypothetical protein THAOC_36457 [Thalassiosira oceanica]|uniref:Uncharacterized protein n=1 Tax=Thalassiosira oceanica TaxID=159749 RepID=K0REI0_THAOC|nr:hypothetical protein THAOC_36457 [Thalassiosira oceanica]|eukprot:EJK44962.1 hypothetical protein THAOC_36457 [Thalassiosira oceanica]